MRDVWFNAIYSSDCKALHALLPNYSDWRTDDGDTGLMIVAERGDLSLTQMLLRYEAGKRNARDETALMRATRSGNISVALLLIPVEVGAKDSNERCALYWAIKTNNVTLFSILVEYEYQIVDSRGTTMLMVAAWYSRRRFILELQEALGSKQDSDGDTALMYALLSGALDSAEILLNELAICNHNGSNALMEAIKCGHGDWLVQRLQCDALRSLAKACDRDGQTPLTLAALYDAPGVVRAVAGSSSDLSIRHAKKALSIAEQAEHEECAKILRAYIDDRNNGVRSTKSLSQSTDIDAYSPSHSTTPTLSEAASDLRIGTGTSDATQSQSDVELDPEVPGGTTHRHLCLSAPEKTINSMTSFSDTVSPVYGYEDSYLRHNQGKKRTRTSARKHASLNYRHVNILFNPKKHGKGKTTLRKRMGGKAVKVKVNAVRKRKRRVLDARSMSSRAMDAPSDMSGISEASSVSDGEIYKYNVDESSYSEDASASNTVKQLLGVASSTHTISRPPSVWTSISKRESVRLDEKHAKKYSARYIRALKAGNILLIRKLGHKEQKHGHYHGESALMYAVRINNLSLIRVLASMEAGRLNPMGESALMIAARKNNFFAARFLLPYEVGYQDSYNYTALMHAAQRGHTEIVRILMKKEAGLQNRIGETALMLATRYCYPDVMALLAPLEGSIADNTGLTPLMHVTLRNDITMVRLLAPHGSRQTTPRGTTALMMAVSRGYYECACILHETEAGMQDNQGRTALMIAAKCGNAEIVRMMVGVEAGMKDKNGNRAGTYAKRGGHSSILFFLHRWESW